jgi:hypothetical protein
MCTFISGYRLPNGQLHFHTDADVEAAWERAEKTTPIDWSDMVGHGGYRFCFGQPPMGSVEVEGLRYAIDMDLRQFAKLMRGAGYASIVPRDAASIAEGDTLHTEANKLWTEARKLQAEADKLWIEAEKLEARARKLEAKAEKLQAEGDRLHTEARKLWIEADKLRVEARKLEAKTEMLWAKANKLWARARKLWAYITCL